MFDFELHRGNAGQIHLVGPVPATLSSPLNFVNFIEAFRIAIAVRPVPHR
jgi:hypothetical protein